VWLAGIPGARETRLTPIKETCRLKQGNLPTEQGNLPTEQGNLPTEQGNLPTEQGNLPTEQENLPTQVMLYFA
jgi:chitinase